LPGGGEEIGLTSDATREDLDVPIRATV